jgi:hypothetical protein
MLHVRGHDQRTAFEGHAVNAEISLTAARQERQAIGIRILEKLHIAFGGQRLSDRG